MAISVTISPIIPAAINTSAIPLPAPTPNQLPVKSTPLPVVVKGINTNWAIGPIRNAVNGDAACSIL